MFDDIVICEISHIDPNGKESCNPHEIAIGNSWDGGILVTLLLVNQEERRLAYANNEKEVDVFVEVISTDKTDFMDKYDIQTGVIVELRDDTEVCKFLIGSNGDHFHYFTNVPSINNSTSYGDTIFLNFPHTVEGFSYNDTNPKIFK